MAKDKREKETLNLIYYREDQFKLYGYLAFIQKCVRNKQKIPSSVVKKLFEILETPLLNDLIDRKQMLQNIKLKVLDKLINSNQDFTIEFKRVEEQMDTPPPPAMKGAKAKTTKAIKNKPALVPYTQTLQNYIDNFFDTLIQDNDFDVSLLDKDKLITISYNSLYTYLSKIPATMRPTMYSQTVIIGYILWGFGILYDVNSYEGNRGNKSYYTEYLHNSTKYICRKIAAKRDKSIK